MRRRAAWAWASGLAALLVLLAAPLGDTQAGVVATTRDFYGVLQVRDADIGTRTPVWSRSLWNGRVLHGAQLLDGGLRGRPFLYYGPDSGVGVAVECVRRLNSRAQQPRLGLRIGVVGLGVGTIAAYGGRGDRLRFYEIDPEVERLARQHFSFLADTEAAVEVVLGDARVSLERELRTGGGERFDVLVLDAFSGDAIPVHLLTREAFATYWSHLLPDGVLAVHVSNRYLDLRPVVAGLATAANKRALWLRTERSNSTGALQSQWILVTGNGRVETDYKVARHLRPLPAWPEGVTAWTDDYSTLVPMLLRGGWLSGLVGGAGEPPAGGG